MTTIKADVSILVNAGFRPKNEARFAPSPGQIALDAFAAELGTVWIVRSQTATKHPSGIWHLSVAVTAPAHELTEDAPIIQRAGRATGKPFDTVQVRTRPYAL